jgi:putative transposase
MSDAALVRAIRQMLTDSPFHGEGYRKVWARLRHAGLRTSKERVRRLMRENGLQAATRIGRPRGPITPRIVASSAPPHRPPGREGERHLLR